MKILSETEKNSTLKKNSTHYIVYYNWKKFSLKKNSTHYIVYYNWKKFPFQLDRKYNISLVTEKNFHSNWIENKVFIKLRQIGEIYTKILWNIVALIPAKILNSILWNKNNNN